VNKPFFTELDEATSALKMMTDGFEADKTNKLAKMEDYVD